MLAQGTCPECLKETFSRSICAACQEKLCEQCGQKALEPGVIDHGFRGEPLFCMQEIHRYARL